MNSSVSLVTFDIKITSNVQFNVTTFILMLSLQFKIFRNIKFLNKKIFIIFENIRINNIQKFCSNINFLTS